jgi:hypothetical protein
MSNETPPQGPPAAPPPYDSAPPYGSPQPAAGVPRPRLVDAAFWLTIAAAALSVVSLVVSIATVDLLRAETLRELEGQGGGDVLPPEVVDGVIIGTLVVGTLFALLFAAAYVVFAILMRKGHGWARWLIAAFAALAFFGVVLTVVAEPGSAGLGVLQFLCLAAATALVFLPASNAFFNAAAQRREARRR